MDMSHVITAGQSAAGLRWLAALPALGLGAFLVFVVGFAQPMMLHNAAHDTRHSLSFPCH
jgi:cobalt transporter subunit CbtB